MVKSALADVTAVVALADDVLRVKSHQLIDYNQIRPAIAHQLVRLLWDLGVPRPDGYAEAEQPSPHLPSTSAEVLIGTLREEDRETAAPPVERICEELDEKEEVHLLSMGKSRSPLLLALTNSRVLWAAPDDQSLIGVSIRYVLRVTAEHGAALVLGLHSTSHPEVAFRELRPALGEAFAGAIKQFGGADAAIVAKLGASQRADQSALSVLPAKTARLVSGSIGPNETVFLVLVGGFGQALIALSDRMVIAKAGLMSGNTFGGKVTAFPYREVTGIELHTGWSTGALAIQTPSYPGTQAGSYWAKGKNTSPAELPNTLPLPSKSVLNSWQTHLQTLRAAVTGGGLTANTEPPPELGPPVALRALPRKQPAAPPVVSSQMQASPSPGRDLSSQLRELAELHQGGVLSDEEFARAKAKLLT